MTRPKRHRNGASRTMNMAVTPVASLPVFVNLTFTGGAVQAVYPAFDKTSPMRPTSIRVSVASASPCVWRVQCTAAGTMISESGPVATCGNSQEIYFRAPKNCQYGSVSDDGSGCNWSIRSSSSGVAAGVAYFSSRATLNASG